MSRTTTFGSATTAPVFSTFGGAHTMSMPNTPWPQSQGQAVSSATDSSSSHRRQASSSSSMAPAPPSQSGNDEPIAFLDLPTDIHLEVANWLPWRAQWSLKRTSRYFHSVPELAAPISFFQQRHRGKAYQHDLLNALCSANVVRRGYEPCYACQRFRWKSGFEIEQFQRGFLWCNAGARGSSRSRSPPAATATADAVEDQVPDESVLESGKFCIECGVKAGKYVDGQTIEVVHQWSDSQSDRQKVVVTANGQTQGGDPRTANVMISEEGMEDLERNSPSAVA